MPESIRLVLVASLVFEPLAEASWLQDQYFESEVRVAVRGCGGEARSISRRGGRDVLFYVVLSLSEPLT